MTIESYFMTFLLLNMIFVFASSIVYSIGMTYETVCGVKAKQVFPQHKDIFNNKIPL